MASRLGNKEERLEHKEKRKVYHRLLISCWATRCSGWTPRTALHFDLKHGMTLGKVELRYSFHQIEVFHLPQVFDNNLFNKVFEEHYRNIVLQCSQSICA